MEIDKTLYTTRPDPEGRLPKEMAVYDLLEKLDIPFVRVDHEVTPSIESCHDVDKLLDIEICKNLFSVQPAKDGFLPVIDAWTKAF